MEAEIKIYRDLQKYLDRMPAGFPEVPSGLDIRLLKRLFTPEEARLATLLSLKPEPIKKIYRRVKNESLSLRDLQNLLDRMAKKGTILTAEEGLKEKYYSSATFSVGGIYNYQVDRLSRDLINDYWQYQAEARSQTRTVNRLPKKTPIRKMLPLRTIPVEKSLLFPEKHAVSSYDDVRKVVENARGKIAVANCICRQSADLLAKPCSRTHLRETCLIIGPDHAKRHVDMGIGRFVSKVEALNILTQAQEAGLILQPENSQNPEAICCCCGDCCVLFKQINRAPCPADFYVTNYYAEVNAELCNGCEVCVQRCQLNARAMVSGVSTVDLNRCIGCGNCVILCPTSANLLKKKEPEVTLFRDKDDYYMTMLSARIGKRKMLMLKARMLLGFKV